MSVLVEALNRSARMQDKPQTQPQARPMPRVVPMLGMAAGICLGFAGVMTAGSVLSPSLAALHAEAPIASPVVEAAPATPVSATAKAEQTAQEIRNMPILEPLAADMDYPRLTKSSPPVPAAITAPPTAAVAEAAKPAAGEAPVRDPKTAATIKSLEAQLERQPDSLETMSQLLGVISSQPPQAALSDLLRLYQAYPRQHVLAAQLGYTYARLNDQESALRYQQWAVTMAPNNPVYLFNVAVLQDRLGKRDEATRNYQQVLLRSNAGGPPVPTAAIRQRLDYLARN